jgi:hypothetical protein
VVVCHRSVIDFIKCFTEIFHITERDVLANQAPFDFDVSVKDIYSGILTGATVEIIPTAYFTQPTKLMDFLCDRKATVLVWAVSALCFITTMNALAAMVGGTVNHHSRYPGWEYAPISAVRDAYTAAYDAVIGGEMQVVAIHAGLECGYIKKQLPDMDIISIGPDMQGIHSPDEVLFLDSVERVWRALGRMIADWNVI